MDANERASASMLPADVFRAVQAHCMSKEGVVEEYPWEDVAWKVKGKMFCVTSKDSNKLTVKSTPEKQQALIQHPRISIAQYVGRYGWVMIEVSDESDCEMALELIDES